MGPVHGNKVMMNMGGQKGKMNHDLKIMCLQAISLGIFGMMGSVIMTLIIEAVHRYKEG